MIHSHSSLEHSSRIVSYIQISTRCLLSAHTSFSFDCFAHNLEHKFISLCFDLHVYINMRFFLRWATKNKRREGRQIYKKYYHNKRWCYFVCLFLHLHFTSVLSGRERKFWILYDSPCCRYYLAYPTSAFIIPFLPFYLQWNYSLWEMNICLCFTFYFYLFSVSDENMFAGEWKF